MKRKNVSLCGNVFMGLGLVMMIMGFFGAVTSYLPLVNLPSIIASGAVLAIFVGALVWLTGARIGGREQISDRYWWIRHFDKRCRRDQY